MMDNLRRTRRADINSAYLGVSGSLLMENAGRELARACEGFSSVAVFCGRGNNGGDGLVAARHLSSLGKRVKVYALQGSRTRDNERNLSTIKRLSSIDLEYVGDSMQSSAISEELKGFDAVIDALLGVGASGEPLEPVRSLAACISSSKAFKISADIPTPGVKPDQTVSFHTPKCEGCRVVGIGVPQEAETFCGPGDVCVSLPERLGPEHKGDFGRVLVIGGSRDYFGAPFLAAWGAARAGVDLVRVACPQYVADHAPKDPSLIISPLESRDYLGGQDLEKILSMDYDSVVLGNGIARNGQTRSFVRDLLREVRKPVVIDADALRLIEKRHIRDNHILAPHSGEYEGLFGKAPGDLKERAVEVRARAKESACVIVLKGPVDVLSDGKTTRFNNSGNPGMTVGGTGDVLAGVAGAFSCFTDTFSAACAASFLAGLAGDICLEEQGYSYSPVDVTGKIPAAIKRCYSFSNQ